MNNNIQGAAIAPPGNQPGAVVLNPPPCTHPARNVSIVLQRRYPGPPPRSIRGAHGSDRRPPVGRTSPACHGHGSHYGCVGDGSTSIHYACRFASASPRFGPFVPSGTTVCAEHSPCNPA